jgi:hypothetical protein
VRCLGTEFPKHWRAPISENCNSGDSPETYFPAEMGRFLSARLHRHSKAYPSRSILNSPLYSVRLSRIYHRVSQRRILSAYGRSIQYRAGSLRPSALHYGDREFASEVIMAREKHFTRGYTGYGSRSGFEHYIWPKPTLRKQVSSSGCPRFPANLYIFRDPIPDVQTILLGIKLHNTTLPQTIIH